MERKINPKDGMIFWTNNYKLKCSRNHDLPTIIWQGNKYWYKKGFQGRDYNLPCIIDFLGDKEHFTNGDRGRERHTPFPILPSYISYTGERAWYVNGCYIKSIYNIEN